MQPIITSGIRACTMAPAHIWQGSSVTYNVQSSSRQSPSFLLARLIAVISACASVLFVRISSIIAPADHLSVMHDHAADWHFAECCRFFSPVGSHPSYFFMYRALFFLLPKPLIFFACCSLPRRFFFLFCTDSCHNCSLCFEYNMSAFHDLYRERPEIC